MKSLMILYDWLEVSPSASQEVIDAAYRALIRKSFNNATGDDFQEASKQIEEAYAVLSDPDRRADYDKARKNLSGKIVGDYRVLELITESAVGEVYKGEHIILGEPACIKHYSVISPVAHELLVEEAKALWDLRHYGLPAIRNIFRLEDGSSVLVMSYLPGPTWEEVIKKNGAMHPEHVIWLAERVLNALRYIHLRGLIHGDVKPGKIIIQPEKIMASLVGFEFSMSKPNALSKSKGYSEIFSSVEAMQGMPLLPASDLYSLGMTMIYALNGDFEETKKRSVPESTPELLCDFIKRLVVKDVLERPSWENEDLCETLEEVRIKSFGKKSRIKPIPWQ